MKKTIGKRILSGITSALLAVSYALPSSLAGGGGLFSARAETIVTSFDENSPNPTDDVTLLVGKNSPLRGDDVNSTLDNAADEYALGIASQFSVFVTGDFSPHESDSEGRTAIGGNLVVSTDWGSYVIAKGDYANGTALSTLLSDSGYASVILGGSVTKGKLSNEYNSPDTESSRLVVLNRDRAEVEADTAKYLAGISVSSGYYDVGYKQVYATKLFDFDEQINMLNERSEKLSKKNDQFNVAYDQDSRTITLTYNGDKNVPTETVYATLSDEELEWFRNAKTVEYVNVPELPQKREIVNNDGQGTTLWEYAYIVINIPQTDNSEDGEVSGLHLGRASAENDSTTTVNGVIAGMGGTLTGNDKSNNLPGVTSLLYNIPNATKLVLGGTSFYGTILAPNADTTDEKSLNNMGPNPHLSGALIAKSFEGYTEFGYRPFTGPITMLGVDVKYGSELKKIDGLGNGVDGAKIGVYESGTAGTFDFDTPNSTITSEDGGKIRIKFGSDTPNTTDSITTYYAVREYEAPISYALSDETFYFETIEEFKKATDLGNTGSDDSILPSKITIKMYKKDTATDAGALKYEVEFGYSFLNDEITEKTSKVTIGTNDPATFTYTRVDSEWVTEDTIDTSLYVADSELGVVYPIMVAPEGANTITDNAQVWFNKVDKGTLQPIEGAELQVLDGTTVFRDNITSTTDEYTRFDIKVGENAENANALELDHDYVLHEVSAPDGYKVASDITFKVMEEDNDYVLYINGEKSNSRVFSMADDEEGRIGIKKSDNGNNLAGATLLLIKLNDSAFDKLNGQTATLIGDLTEGTDYEVVATIDDTSKTYYPDTLTPGFYGLVETVVPDGYSAASKDIVNVFTIKPNGQPVVNKIVDEVYEVGSAYSSNPVEISNAAIKSKDSADKMYAITASDFPSEGDYLLTKISVKTWDTDASWNDWEGNTYTALGVNVSKLGQQGDYSYLTEITFDKPVTKEQIEGFTVVQAWWQDNKLDSMQLYFAEKNMITAAQNVEIKGANGFAAGKSGERNGKDIYTVSLENTATGYNIVFRKSGENGASISDWTGAKFALYSADASGNPTGTALATAENAGTFNIKFTYFPFPGDQATSDRLVPGNYVIVEESAPTGYEKSGNIYFSINRMGMNVTYGTSPTTKTNYPVIETADAGATQNYIVPMADKRKVTGISFDKVDDGRTLSSVGESTYGSELAADGVVGAKMQLTLTKANVTGDTLSGVTCSSDEAELAISDNLLSITWTTTGEPLTIDGLPDGEYTLKEIETPDGYQPMADSSLKIDDGEVTGSLTLSIDGTTVTATDKLYSLSIRKTMPNSSPASINDDTPVPGAVLQLTGKDKNGNNIDFQSLNIVARDNQIFTGDGHGWNDHATPQTIKDNIVGEITTTAEGAPAYEWTSIGSAVLFMGLPEGDYTIHEVSAPLGYEKSKDITFSVGRNPDTNELYMTSGKDAGQSYDQITVFDESWDIDISKQNMGGTVIEEAKFELTKKDGTAFDENSIAIKTYQEDLDDVTIKLVDDGDADANNNKAVEIEHSGEYTIRGNTFNHVSINGTAVNDEVKQNDYIYEGNSNGKLTISGLYDGAYTVTFADDRTVYSIRADYNKTELTSVTKSVAADLSDDGKTISFTGGDVTLTGLADGTYVLKEISAPTGYEVVSTFEFTVNDGSIDYKTIEASTNGLTEEEAEDAKADVDSHVSLARNNDSKLIIKDDSIEETVELLINKVDQKNTGIANAELELVMLTDDGETRIGETWLSSGSLETPQKFADLAEGKYAIREIDPPDTYRISSKLIDSKYLATFDLNKDGIENFEAADGNLNVSGKIITINLRNEQSRIKINKFSDDGKTQLSGAKLVLKNADINWDEILKDTTLTAVKDGDKTIGVQWTSGETAREFLGLPDGTYQYTEESAPDGYYLSNDVVTFTIEQGVIASITNNKETVTGDPSLVNKTTTTTTTTSTTTTTTTTTVLTETVNVNKLKLVAAETEGSEGTTENLSGAILQLTRTDVEKYEFSAGLIEVGAEGSLINGSGSSLIWKSGNTSASIKLEAGTYLLHEMTAPDGYYLADDITFTVSFSDDEDHTVEINIVSNDDSNNTVTKPVRAVDMIDKAIETTTSTTATEATKSTETETTATTATTAEETTTTTVAKHEVNISKQDVGEAEVKGATISLKGETKSGEEVVFEKDSLTYSEDSGVVLISGSGDTLVWQSGDKAVKVKVEDGTYTLHEVAAPDGYEVT
ncbi:MAG: choice-of-anchor A family protein, partial [Ruminococcus sp.]|nr:choice-of-anchor A family protein [Ruminococcus sp.]